MRHRGLPGVVDLVIDSRVRLPLDLRPASERVAPDEVMTQYDAVLGLGSTRQRSLQDLVADMDEAGVGHAVVHAEYEFGDPADALNEAVAALVAQQPSRFSGFGTISMEPLRVMRAVRQVGAVAEAGLLGINIQPSFFAMAIDDRRLYPVYAKAEELGLGVGLHTGVNYSVVHPIKNDHPLQLDQVACDFPGLTLVACHAGWPWAAEMVAVARKHPSVLLEFGGLAPRYVGEPGTGWEVVRRFMDSLLRDQVLFGTDWPVFPMRRAIDEWRQMGLKPDVLAALLSGNAQRLLRRAMVTPPSAVGASSPVREEA